LFGFITVEGSGDVFVHFSAIQGSGYKKLAEGESVTLDVYKTEKGLTAKNVTRSK